MKQLDELLAKSAEIVWKQGPKPPQPSNVVWVEGYDGRLTGILLLLVQWTDDRGVTDCEGIATFNKAEFNVVRLPKEIAADLVAQAQKSIALRWTGNRNN